MKKVVLCFLIFAMLVCFAACGEQANIEVTADGTNAGAPIGSVTEPKADKAPVPDEEYVLYKETATQTGRVLLYEYNSNGHLAKITKSFPDGRTEENIYTYTYAPDGGYTVHSTGYLTEHISEYDSNGRLLKDVVEPNGRTETTVYTYGDDGSVEYKTEVDGRIKKWMMQTYDKNGLLVKEVELLSDGRTLASVEYFYDENGNETTRKYFNDKGEQSVANAEYVWTEEYDSYGRIVKKEQRNSFGGLQHDEHYEYDENGGMCKMTSTTSTVEREYRPLSQCMQ